MVITTVQKPTEAVRQFISRLRSHRARMIVVGDKKGPPEFGIDGVEFLGLADQANLSFGLIRDLPTAHYARKNIGYLVAMAGGAECIYETDDDNAPTAAWGPRPESVEAVTVEGRGWTNVYRMFTGEKIWPRGFPPEELNASFARRCQAPVAAAKVRAPVQQGLVDDSPDVDAVWRLIFDRPFRFQDGPSAHVPPGSWCPFNSQSTWWRPVAYPLLYLPSHCSFRMTDIWRSFIAQRCLWELCLGIVFHAPEVIQERNPHDLMRDFTDELPGYLGNKRMAMILEGLDLEGGEAAVGQNLLQCYEALVKADFFPEKELGLVKAWLRDWELVWRHSGGET